MLDQEPEVSRFYAELVPVKLTPEEFWSRYAACCLIMLNSKDLVSSHSLFRVISHLLFPYSITLCSS